MISPFSSLNARRWFLNGAEWRGVLLNYVHIVVAGTVFVAVTPAIIRGVGPDIYGVWVIFSAIAGYLMFADFGLAVAVARYTAVHRTSGSADSLNVTLSTLLVAFLALALLVVALSAAIAPWIAQVVDIPAAARAGAPAAITLMGANIGATFLALFAGNVTYGAGRVDVSKAASALGQIVGAAATIGLLSAGMGLTGLALATLGGTLTTLTINAIFVGRCVPGLRLNPLRFQSGVMKEVAPYGARTFVLGITSRVLYYTGALVIGLVLGTAAVAGYELTYKVCFFASYLFSSISTALFPKFASLSSSGAEDELRTAYLRTVRLSLLIGVPTSVCLLAFTPPLLDAWVGPGLFAGYGVLLVLVAMNLMHAIGTPAAMLLQSTGRNAEMMKAEIANALVNIVLSLILVRVWGVAGVAAATLIAHLSTSFWVIQIVPGRMLRLSYAGYWRTCILYPLAAAIPAALAVAALARVGDVDSLFEIVAGSGVVFAMYGATYLGAMYLWKLTRPAPAAALEQRL